MKTYNQPKIVACYLVQGFAPSPEYCAYKIVLDGWEDCMKSLGITMPRMLDWIATKSPSAEKVADLMKRPKVCT